MDRNPNVTIMYAATLYEIKYPRASAIYRQARATQGITGAQAGGNNTPTANASAYTAALPSVTEATPYQANELYPGQAPNFGPTLSLYYFEECPCTTDVSPLEFLSQPYSGQHQGHQIMQA